MEIQNPLKEKAKFDQVKKPPQKTNVEDLNASGKWNSVKRIRLPHKVGLPLSSGGCGDAIER